MMTSFGVHQMKKRLGTVALKYADRSSEGFSSFSIWHRFHNENRIPDLKG